MNHSTSFDGEVIYFNEEDFESYGNCRAKITTFACFLEDDAIRYDDVEILLKDYFQSWKDIDDYTCYHSRIEADLKILLNRFRNTGKGVLLK